MDKEIDIIHGNLEGEELLEAQKELEMMKEEVLTDNSTLFWHCVHSSSLQEWIYVKFHSKVIYFHISSDFQFKKFAVL